MRISDWSSDVCSSDLKGQGKCGPSFRMVGCGDPDTKRFGKTPRDRQPQPATAMPVAASALGKGIEDRPLGAWFDPLAAIAHGQCHADRKSTRLNSSH